jgi:hypothetical protein
VACGLPFSSVLTPEHHSSAISHFGERRHYVVSLPKEVVMLFCDGYAQKKLLPLDRIATANPCLGDFHDCPMFKEVITRLAAAREAEFVAPPGRPSPPPAPGKERSS